MATLLIDNYDSYTFNLYQLLERDVGEQPVVVRNDEIARPVLAAEPWDRIVISPGPGRPERERDLGICAAALAQDDVPVLGVRLGHQGLAYVRGATVVRADEIVHGRISPVLHRGDGIIGAAPMGERQGPRRAPRMPRRSTTRCRSRPSRCCAPSPSPACAPRRRLLRAADKHWRAERRALVQRDDVADVHADAAVRGA